MTLGSYVTILLTIVALFDARAAVVDLRRMDFGFPDHPVGDSCIRRHGVQELITSDVAFLPASGVRLGPPR
jgi:hypothetical protein